MLKLVKPKKTICLLIMLILIIVSQCSAEELKLSTVLNLGETFPLGNLGNSLKSGIIYPLGVNIGLDTSIFMSNTNIELGFNYISLVGKSDDSTKMTFLPLTISALYNFLLEENIKPFVKLGGGVVFEKLTIAGSSTNNTDPIFHGGMGANYNLSNNLFLRLEALYNFIYQTYQSGATENGNLFSIDLGIGYKF